MQSHLKLIDDVLKNHLQKEVTISVNNKTIRTGKFILYNFQDYHVELDVIYNNKVKKTTLPIPFNLEHYEQESLIYFDYRVTSLYTKINKTHSENKFYDKILEIQFK